MNLLVISKMYKYFALLLLSGACSVVHCNVTYTCSQKEVCSSYLDVAMDMISKAKYNIPTCNLLVKSKDCAEVLEMGRNRSGVYQIWPVSRMAENRPLDVYCDMDTNGGGWTVIQRRGNFQRPKDFFFKDWKSYKVGFGDIEKDFWIGNDNIFALTNQRVYSARFDLKDVDRNRRYALYDTFWTDDETNKYTLHLSDYSGNAGDSMIPEHNNHKFSTKDQDNDTQKDQNCAQIYKGGWWYSACHQANLNGLYLRGKHESFADGMEWHSWKGYHESLEWTEIKIRPRSFRPTYESEMTPM